MTHDELTMDLPISQKSWLTIKLKAGDIGTIKKTILLYCNNTGNTRGQRQPKIRFQVTGMLCCQLKKNNCLPGTIVIVQQFNLSLTGWNTTAVNFTLLHEIYLPSFNFNHARYCRSHLRPFNGPSWLCQKVEHLLRCDCPRLPGIRRPLLVLFSDHYNRRPCFTNGGIEVLVGKWTELDQSTLQNQTTVRSRKYPPTLLQWEVGYCYSSGCKHCRIYMWEL